MLEELWSSMQSNLTDILVTLGGGFIFFILSIYGIKKYVTSAERERLKQAKNSLLDILESRIVNKQDISVYKINILLRAISRENSVDLSERSSPVALLQDLQLRFEKSRQLDPNQKEGYCNKIETHIREITTKKETEDIPKRYSEIVETLQEEIKSKNTGEALETLETLKKKIEEREEYVFGPTPFHTMISEYPLMFAALTIVVMVFYIYVFRTMFI